MTRNIVIFGASGVTGLCALKYAVSKGYIVRAFVRNAERIPEEFVNKIEITVGDVKSYDDVLKALKNKDEVVVVLGTRNVLEPTYDLSNGMKNIVKAMEETNIKLVSLCLSSFLFHEVIPNIFIYINNEHKRMLEVVENSNLNWVAVCPPRIEDCPGGSKYCIQPKAPPTGSKISKFDLGEYLVECLQNPDNFCKKLCIFNE